MPTQKQPGPIDYKDVWAKNKGKAKEKVQENNFSYGSDYVVKLRRLDTKTKVELLIVFLGLIVICFFIFKFFIELGYSTNPSELYYPPAE